MRLKNVGAGQSHGVLVLVDQPTPLSLSQAGVAVELHLHSGVPHEYDAIAYDADVSRRALAGPTAPSDCPWGGWGGSRKGSADWLC